MSKTTSNTNTEWTPPASGFQNNEALQVGASYTVFYPPGWILIAKVKSISEDGQWVIADTAWVDGVNGDHATTDISGLSVNAARGVGKRYRPMRNCSLNVQGSFWIRAVDDLEPLLRSEDLNALKERR